MKIDFNVLLNYRLHQNFFQTTYHTKTCHSVDSSAESGSDDVGTTGALTGSLQGMDASYSTLGCNFFYFLWLNILFIFHLFTFFIPNTYAILEVKIMVTDTIILRRTICKNNY
jgi:hypothetical protein